jgi:hypothetical protein
MKTQRHHIMTPNKRIPTLMLKEVFVKDQPSLLWTKVDDKP